MNKKFTKLIAALALLACITIPMGMWGQETVTATSTTMTASVSYQDLETGKLIEYKNSASNSYSQPLRIYANNTFTIHAKEGVEKITQIAIVANNASYGTATGNATWTATGEGSCTATASVNGTNVTVTITGTATTVTCKPSAQVRWDQLSVTYVTSGTPPAITYTMTYDANGGTGTMIDDNSPYDANAIVTVLDNVFTREHFNFVKWNTKSDGTGTDYDEGDTFTINGNTTLYAQWESDGTGGEGSICFSNQSSCTAINSTSVTGDDDLGNTWTITTVGTSSFTPNSGYYQVGSGNSPASSITFTTTLDEEVNVTSFSATFGGFSATRASVVLKVDNTQVGSGSLNGSDDVTVSSSSAQIGTTLTVIVTPTAGGVKCYNISYAYETIDNPAVATTTTITAPNDFNTDLHNGTNAGTLSATVTVTSDGTPVSGATVTWSSSNTGVATIDANGAVTLVAVGTTTITANYAGVEDQYRPSEGTYELTVIDSYAPGSVNNPYTVAQAIANTPSGGNVYIHGIVSSFYNTSIVGDGSNYRYYISDDGSTTTQLLVYKGKGLNQATFTNANDLLVGDEVTIYGELITYSNAPEVASGNYLTSLVRPNQYTLTNAMTNVAEYHVFVGDTEIEFDNNNQAQVSAGATVYVSLTMEDCYALTSLTVNGSTTGVTEEEPGVYYSFVMPEDNATIGTSATQATQYTLTVVGAENVTFDMLAGVESTPVSLTNGTASICEQLFVSIANLSANSGLALQSVTLTAGGSTTTLTLEDGVYHFNMPSSNATLTFTTAEVTTYTYTRASSIVSGNTYIIVGQNNGVYYAMGSQRDNNRGAAVITVNGTTATVSSEDVYEFTISSLAELGFYSIYDARTPGYLYAAASGSNHLKTETTLDGNHNGDWEITFDAESGTASIVASNSSNRNYMRFNQQSHIFSCYASNNYTSQHPVYLYERVYTKEIEAGQWYLISSPVGNVAPTAVGNMTEEQTYGLFTFDQTGGDDGKEWRNYKAGAFTQLEAGKGYLYINEAGCTLSFTGTAYNGEGTFPLFYSDVNETETFHGLNLLGNPYAQSAAIDHDYYIMNANGTDLTPYTISDIVPAMQGVFVQVTEEGQSVTFTPSQSTTGGKGIEINLTQNRGAIVDRAIVRFGEGRQLSKVQLFDNSTKLYISQNGKDYAIVSTEAQGELPVNFSASENGTYTLGMDVKNMDVNYLHLIDNMTGMDVDLLQTPSYTFEATTTDYESRFRLVFASNNANTDSDNFAFFSNGNLIINNEGNATLQVIDLNGRILSSESVNGSVSTTLNATPGVYMLRLINGENVKVQKIVVR